MTISRRDFIRVTGLTVFCSCVGATGVSSCSMGEGVSNIPLIPENNYSRNGDQIILSLTNVSLLQCVGSFGRIVVDDNSEDSLKIIILHLEEGMYRAFANHCTHRGKEVDHIQELNQLQCTSGHSRYDMKGNVLEGNAETPLRIFPTSLEGDELVINLNTSGG